MAQAALEAILNLQPFEWYMKGLAAKGALRLRESNLWKMSNYGHSRILAELGKLGTKKERRWINQLTDHMIAKDRLRWEVDISTSTRRTGLRTRR